MLPAKRDEERLLYAMGWETANIHLGSARAIPRILRDLEEATLPLAAPGVQSHECGHSARLEGLAQRLTLTPTPGSTGERGSARQTISFAA